MQAIFAMWKTVTQMAHDLGEAEPTVRGWKRRNSIPGDRDVVIVEHSKRIGKPVTFEELAQIRHTQRVTAADKVSCA